MLRVPIPRIKMASNIYMFRVKVNSPALAFYRDGVSIQDTQEVIDGDSARVIVEADVSDPVISIVPLTIAGKEAIR